jgi:hypothetical protein
MRVVAHSDAESVFLAEERVTAAGVVAEHSADGAAAVCGGIWPEKEAGLFVGGFAKMIEDAAGLNVAEAALGVDAQDLVHVFRKIHDDGDVAALAGEAGSASAGKNRGIVLAGEANGGFDILNVSGNDDADGGLAVIGAVGGVEGARSLIEADFSIDRLLESAGEGLRCFGPNSGAGIILAEASESLFFVLAKNG